MNIDSIMKELAEYIRMGEEIAANIDALKDALKQYMRETGVDSLTGTDKNNVDNIFNYFFNNCNI